METSGSEHHEEFIRELQSHPEQEWLEFKKDNADPQMIGEYISALSNAATLSGRQNAFMVWGIDDQTHIFTNTTFDPGTTKKGGELHESWLNRQLQPCIAFSFRRQQIDNKSVVLLTIPAADQYPVSFSGIEYIRVGSAKKKLKDTPHLEKNLWQLLSNSPFEERIALSQVKSEDVLQILDYPAYFDLLSQPLPENRTHILDKLSMDRLIVKKTSRFYDITHLGSILFAKDLNTFPRLARKSIRIIFYQGKNKLLTKHEHLINKGYAIAFQDCISYIMARLPQKEQLVNNQRTNQTALPELSIRELIANALIHQDFDQSGTSALIEIYDDRMEISNPGVPLINSNRLLDSPPRSRNETLAAFMRRIGFCEERGSGIDKVVAETELYQLPAPVIDVSDHATVVILFQRKEFNAMNAEEKMHACYMHSCLKYVQRESMTNTSLRTRFGIPDKNSALVSRIIRETVNKGLIKPVDEQAAKKSMKYLPFWG